MGQCECGHEHSGKFCPECGKASVVSSDGGSNERLGEGGQTESSSSDSSGGDGGTDEQKKQEAPKPTSQVRRSSGPRVVRVTTKKSETSNASASKSVSTRKIVKKALPSSNGKSKAPTVRTRVVANIERKQAREDADSKKSSGNSMRDKIRHASGWRWM